MRLRLLIADDHQLMLEAVRLALRDALDIEIVGAACSGEEVLPLARRTSPDVVLLDLRMPGMDGLRCLELLHERHPRVKPIVFSASDDPGVGIASLERGAAAFLHKTIDPDELAEAIRRAFFGVDFFTVGLVRSVEDSAPACGLTSREDEILRAAAEGLSNRQIAARFWLSEQTVKYHLTNIYRKLSVGNRTEAVHHAYEHGLIENPVLRTALTLS
jgi:DNA-binding NarL/FixJ family response regulator